MPVNSDSVGGIQTKQFLLFPFWPICSHGDTFLKPVVNRPLDISQRLMSLSSQCPPGVRKICAKKGNWESREINGFGEDYKRGSGTEVTSSDLAHSPVLTPQVILPGKTASTYY